MQKNRFGFSLIEISIVILIIGVLVIGITKGSRIVSESRLKSAQTLSKSSPINVTPDLALWPDATDLSSIATGSFGAGVYSNQINNGATVTNWKDRAIANNGQLILSAPDAPSMPTYVKSGIGGLPSLNFSASGNYLANANGLIRNGEDYTMIAVFQRDANNTQSLIFGQFAGSGFGSNRGLFLENDGSAGSIGYGPGYDFVPFVSVAGKPNILVVRYNKTPTLKFTVHLNSSSQSGNPGSTPNPQFAGIYVGGNASGSGNLLNFNGKISEIMVFNRALKDSEISEIKSYLSKKYGVKL